MQFLILINGFTHQADLVDNACKSVLDDATFVTWVSPWYELLALILLEAVFEALSPVDDFQGIFQLPEGKEENSAMVSSP